MRHELPHLTPEEVALYAQLRFDRIKPRLRLEQERIGYGWLGDYLTRFSTESRIRASHAS